MLNVELNQVCAVYNVPVSYTHLDVYKRQIHIFMTQLLLYHLPRKIHHRQNQPLFRHLRLKQEIRSILFFCWGFSWPVVQAVSYTHLAQGAGPLRQSDFLSGQ